MSLSSIIVYLGVLFLYKLLIVCCIESFLLKLKLCPRKLQNLQNSEFEKEKSSLNCLCFIQVYTFFLRSIRLFTVSVENFKIKGNEKKSPN